MGDMKTTDIDSPFREGHRQQGRLAQLSAQRLTLAILHPAWRAAPWWRLRGPKERDI